MADVPRVDFSHSIIDTAPPHDPHVKAVGDIDGDARMDIVVASSDGGPLVWYQAPHWGKHVISPSGKAPSPPRSRAMEPRGGGWSCDARVLDMDGDGDADVLISEWYGENRLEWYENPRPGGDPARDPWLRHIIGSPRAHDIRVGDIDGDGRIEIATRSQGEEGREVIIWKRRGGDSWSRRSISCPAGEGLALGALARPGRLDVVIGGRWYESPGDVLADDWREHVFADWPPDAVVQAADMNRDGRLDVVLTRSEGHHRLSWFEAPSDARRGAWREHVVDDSVDFAHSLAVCDANGDGQPDLVTAEMHQSPRKRVLLYLGQEGGAKWTRQVLAETGSHNLCIAALDSSGRLGLVGANWSGDHQPLEMWEQRPRVGE